MQWDFLVDGFKHCVRLFRLDELDNLFDAHFRLLTAEPDADDITFLDIGGGFGNLIVDGDAAAVAGLGGDRAPLDQAADFQKFINSHNGFLLKLKSGTFRAGFYI